MSRSHDTPLLLRFLGAGNKLYDNFDAGLSLVETSRTYVTGNEFNRNNWGIRALAGANDNMAR